MNKTNNETCNLINEFSEILDDRIIEIKNEKYEVYCFTVIVKPYDVLFACDKSIISYIDIEPKSNKIKIKIKISKDILTNYIDNIVKLSADIRKNSIDIVEDLGKIIPFENIIIEPIDDKYIFITNSIRLKYIVEDLSKESARIQIFAVIQELLSTCKKLTKQKGADEFAFAPFCL